MDRKAIWKCLEKLQRGEIFKSDVMDAVDKCARKQMIYFADAYHKRAKEVGRNCKAAEWFVDDFLENGRITNFYENQIEKKQACVCLDWYKKGTCDSNCHT